MRFLPLAFALLLLAAAFDLAQTAVTRPGVGPFEYATVALLEALLLRAALHVFRRARHHS
jgi:hypothetical protein